MASSRYLISSQTLGSSQTSVTFSSIPSGYTDLSLKISARTDNAGTDFIQLTINSQTGTYSNTLLLGNGSTSSSTRNTGQSYLRAGYVNNANDTSSTFSYGEIYIPNYTSTNDKPLSSIGYTENNATTAYISNYANLFQYSSAITSLTMVANGNFIAGSSFYLYGLKSN